ncbi:STAS/SEC14 domain-containing protein [Spongiimicrobium salis]|uniref:STAS/SEC14 domain-containing protein n=1 Tax=Spongiimicrobium salis TaxID=1667022 RepID=UPI00374DC38D
MSAKIDKTLLKEHQLDIGTIRFYKNYMIVEVKEGIAFSFENATELLALSKAYYSNTTPFVYISNRINSYSFNPTSHFKTVPMFPNLKGYAVVTYDAMSQDIAQMEQTFLHAPVQIFTQLEDAVAWVSQCIVMD